MTLEDEKSKPPPQPTLSVVDLSSFTDFSIIIESMGGLDARIDIPAADITSPHEP